MSKTKAVEPARRLSLWDIEAAWVPLLDARIAAETDPELSDERPACATCKGVGAPWNNSASVPCSACGGEGSFASPREIAIQAADVALAEHAEREVQKADSYIGLIRYLEAAATVRRAEAARNQTAARILEAMLASVKATAVNVMTVTERKRIEGSAGYLTVKGNGGVAPLLITDPSMVPDDCVRLQGSIPLLVWRGLLESAGIHGVEGARFEKVIDNAAIRAKLKRAVPEMLRSSDEWPIFNPWAGRSRDKVPGVWRYREGRRTRGAALRAWPAFED